MSYRSLLVATLAALALAAPNAVAATVTYLAIMNGPSEAPPNASTAQGIARVTIDTTLSTMRVQSSFSGLIGTTTAAHIHCCTILPGDGIAGVATQTPSFFGFPLGVQFGLMDRTFDMTLSSSYRAGFITANGGNTSTAFQQLIAGVATGRAYFNIHTTEFPGGEIRGFLVTNVPAPPLGALLCVGIAGVLGLRRRTT